MKLFKYKSCEHIEDVIINSRLYCSVFNKLNDPMEWAFNSKLTQRISKIFYLEQIRNHGEFAVFQGLNNSA